MDLLEGLGRVEFVVRRRSDLDGEQKEDKRMHEAESQELERERPEVVREMPRDEVQEIDAREEPEAASDEGSPVWVKSSEPNSPKVDDQEQDVQRDEDHGVDHGRDATLLVRGDQRHESKRGRPNKNRLRDEQPRLDHLASTLRFRREQRYLVFILSLLHRHTPSRRVSPWKDTRSESAILHPEFAAR
eukprot:CAMPEP_0197387724 /NCGR_PEP_ID=MMETSP1165-20131217/689_1 /TAXON_ID=284809 /ORGANISM="Chrysocystis fragilis, Strain CCMP3189" /LENGTH=187 /DNA_ID=CAMNT_0042913057 /DNA_START=189 /DNA_END=748 /DNA_ORIENTATION=-